MKKLEKLEKYVIIPNTRFYGGYVFDGEDINLCDDTFTDYEVMYIEKEVARRCR